MTEIFCQICRHPVPGHEAGCPVGTGEPVRANPGIPQGLYQDQQQVRGVWDGMQSLQAGAVQQTQEWLGSRQDGYEVAEIYREARDKLLGELKMQVEVNKRLARELIDCRLELEKMKAALGGV